MRRGGGSFTVDFYREECAEHGRHIEGCTDECVLSEKTYEVSGYVSAYDPGRTWGPPENCYPPEGGEAEIEKITLDGQAVDDSEFSEKDFDRMIESLQDAAMDDDGCDEDDYDDGPDDYDDGPPDSFDPPDHDGF